VTTEIFPTRLGLLEGQWREGRLQRLQLLPQPAPTSGKLSPLAKQVQAHFQGQPQDFLNVPLDTTALSPFATQVYRAAQKVPAGSVATYADLARAIGSPGATRAVGTALGKNPFLLVVPCHRVLSSGAGLGGFSAPGGATTKALMLAAEGYGVESLWDQNRMQEGTAFLQADPRLGPLIARVGPCTLQASYPDHPFAALARNVLYQQLAGSAARAIEKRVAALGQSPFPGPERLLALPHADLRAAGLSGPKIEALWALSRAVLEGHLRVEELRLLPDQQVVEAVSQVRGLGSWSAEMFLMFHLGRRDLLPVKDLGIRKGFARLFGRANLPEPAQMERWAKPWRPYRTLASWYLWRSLELFD
jgi:O-6-methylguanine DNA methyltransferase